MGLELQALKCPHCGEASGLQKESLGRYRCKFCNSIVLNQGEDEASLIVLPSAEEWKSAHDAVKANKADLSLLDAVNLLNQSFPVNLEAEIQSIDLKTANSIKHEIQALAGELRAFKDKGKTWNRLCQAVLRVVFCRSLFGDFDTVAQIVADINECSSIGPNFWSGLYKNYFSSATSGGGDLSSTLSVARIKESLHDKAGKYDEFAFYEFAEFLARTAQTEKQYIFYCTFINDTLNDAEFVKQVYPVKTLLFSRGKRKHVKFLSKKYKDFTKMTEEGGKK